MLSFGVFLLLCDLKVYFQFSKVYLIQINFQMLWSLEFWKHLLLMV